MSCNNGMVIQIAKLGLLLMLGLSMSACAGLFGFGGTSWKEEVLLHDGSKIIVSRSVSRGGRHEIRQNPPIKEQSLTFTMPSTKERITWEDPYSADVGSTSFLPMLVDIHQGAAYLVAYATGCLSYNKWGRPNPPYVIFKYDGKVWQRIPLQELPVEIKMPNLIFSMPDIKVEEMGKSFITAENIQGIIGNYRQPEYRTILREPMAKVQEGCGEMIYDGKGKWIGIGWFSEKPSYGACLNECKFRKIDAQYCPCETLFKEKK